VIAHQGPVDERWFSRCGATATAVVPFDLGAGDLEVRVPLD
jgi:hypothetical protein